MATIQRMTMLAFGSAAIVEAETYEPAIAPQAVTLTQPRQPAAEQYRVLRYRLECLAKAGHQGAGVHLARSRAKARPPPRSTRRWRSASGGRNRVVLVDADLRRPGVANDAGAARQQGPVRRGRRTRVDRRLPVALRRRRALRAAGRQRRPTICRTTLYDPRLGERDGGAQAALRLRRGRLRRRCCRWPTCRRCAAISTAR